MKRKPPSTAANTKILSGDPFVKLPVNLQLLCKQTATGAMSPRRWRKKGPRPAETAATVEPIFKADIRYIGMYREI